MSRRVRSMYFVTYVLHLHKYYKNKPPHSSSPSEQAVSLSSSRPPCPPASLSISTAAAGATASPTSAHARDAARALPPVRHFEELERRGVRLALVVGENHVPICRGAA